MIVGGFGLKAHNNKYHPIKVKCNQCEKVFKNAMALSSHKRFCKNHKITSIKKLAVEKQPVYCLTINEYHNFALASGIFVHNCHDCSITREFEVQRKTGIDAFEKIGVVASKYCEFKCMDLRNMLELGEKSFDAVVQLDVIEHLYTKEECNKLVEDMEKIARKLVVHTTPVDIIECENFNSDAYKKMSGFNDGYRFNLLQKHSIQLSKEYFLEKGYEVIVVGGNLKNFLAWKIL